MKLIQMLLFSLITITSSTVFAIGVNIGDDVKQTVKAKNLINVGIGWRVTAEQTIASVRGNVKIGGNLTRTVSAGNIVNVAVGLGTSNKQSVSSIQN